MKIRKLILLVGIIAQIFLQNCSDRLETPYKGKDSTIKFLSKSGTGIEASIIFCKSISKKTGKPIKADTVFNLMEKSKIYAVVNLYNREFNKDRALMFHIDWLDSTGNSFYKKRIDLPTGDSALSITSSIALTPEKRRPGSYNLRVYLFRELIAEKNFHLFEAKSELALTEKANLSIDKKKPHKKENKKKIVKPKVKVENISASIIFCSGVSKKTGKLLGEDSIFTIKEKRKVKAIVKIENHDIKTNQQMNFYFEWIGPDGNQFYRKKITYTTSNPVFTLSNSISIAPEKRVSGIYDLKVRYKKKIIAEQKFELVEKQAQKKNLITE
jgi:hypothetical protein